MPQDLLYTLEDAEEIISQFDLDGNQKVEFDEFLKRFILFP